MHFWAPKICIHYLCPRPLKQGIRPLDHAASFVYLILSCKFIILCLVGICLDRRKGKNRTKAEQKNKPERNHFKQLLQLLQLLRNDVIVSLKLRMM